MAGAVPMTIWLVRDLEPIPGDRDGPRLMRAGMLAQALARDGFDVRWITSSFDHYRKRQRTPGREDRHPEPGLVVTVLPGPGYRRNISLARIRHNRAFARAFAAFAATAPERPGLVVTDLPTTETAAGAVAFARARAIPAIVSIRDLWPDFFTNVLPPPLRPLGRLALWPLVRQARAACAGADALVGISDNYLAWGLAKAGRPRGPMDRIIPLGYQKHPLPLPAARAARLAALGVRPEARLVAFVGSWGQTYDLHLLAETADLLKRRDDIQFLVAGSGDRSDHMRQRFARLPNVVLPGWIGAADIGIVLDRADLGLLPYKPDAPQGLPNKVFEYMAYGAYQIATIAGELDRFYAENGAGIALAAPTPPQFARAIEEALATPGIAAGRAARIAAFEQSAAADVVYARFIDLVRQLAGNPVPG